MTPHALAERAVVLCVFHHVSLASVSHQAARREIGEAPACGRLAVEVFRRLAAANAAVYEPDLAMSLNNLSLRLAEAGRDDEAKRISREAVELSERAG